MAGKVFKVIMNNGLQIPRFGLGTWLSAPGEVGKAVKHAIDVGYRLFDCAFLYGNEREIGEALREKIAEGAVRRQDLFVVTKLWNTFHEKEQVVPACKKSLENFGLDYVDLYLVHWPVAQKLTGPLDVNYPFANAVAHNYDYVDTWKGMEECVKQGYAKSIGVSNFNSKQLQRVLDAALIRPVANEIEVHPNLTQKKLIHFCVSRNIHVLAYSPFASPKRPWQKPGDPVLDFNDPRLVNIAEKYRKTTYQVVLRYLLDVGVIPIPKSSNMKRLAQNIDVFDFKLTEEEVKIIDGFECNGRVVHAKQLSVSPDYPFTGVEF